MEFVKFNISINQGLDESLKAYMRRVGAVNRSQIIREALTEYLERKQPATEGKVWVGK